MIPTNGSECVCVCLCGGRNSLAQHTAKCYPVSVFRRKKIERDCIVHSNSTVGGE